MSQRVHFIAIGGSAMHNLAIALQQQGFDVSGSDDEIFEPSRSRLDRLGLLPDKLGWDPYRITTDLNAVILGISFDTPEDNKKFAEKFHFNYPLICDTDRKIGTAYGANVDPAKGAQRVGVVIDRDGKIKEWHERVDARAWPAEVIKTL